MIEYNLTGKGNKAKLKSHIQATDGSKTLTVTKEGKPVLIKALKQINAGQAIETPTISAEVFLIKTK